MDSARHIRSHRRLDRVLCDLGHHRMGADMPVRDVQSGESRRDRGARYLHALAPLHGLVRMISKCVSAGAAMVAWPLIVLGGALVLVGAVLWLYGDYMLELWSDSR